MKFQLSSYLIIFLSLILILILYYAFFGILYVYFKNSVSKCLYLEHLNSDDITLYHNGYTNLTNPDFLHYIRSNIIIDPPRNNVNGVNLSSKGDPDYSQIGQSRYVDALLKQKRNGFFLECGAADGEYLSNSLFFELQRNWTGVLIEPNYDFFQTLLLKRRNVFAVNGCLSVSNKVEKMPFLNAKLYGGIQGSFTDRRAFQEKESNSMTKVLCIPLMAILNALGNPKIDYLSLDVEGAETLVLNTVNWTKVYIDVLTVEYNTRYSKIKEIRKIFQSTGIYKEIGILGKHQDIVFKRIK